MLELKHLRKAYPSAIPLKDVNVTINEGDVICIIGPSGTGKSTLIRCMNLLDQPTSGEIYFHGKNILEPKQYDKEMRMKIGMVFQSYNLFGHMTVIENVMYAPVQHKGMKRQEAYDKGMDYLRKVGMAEKALNYPDELSGGQMQRTAIARTLAMEPELILLDEPTSALDPTMVGEVETVIRDMAEAGKTMLIVTHSMNLARNVANRIFYMDQGGIYEDGPPEQIFEHPIGERTRAFIQRLKTLEIAIHSADHDFIASMNAIENFAVGLRLSKLFTSHIQSVFEEICMQTLLPRLGSDVKMHIYIEYSDETKKTQMKLLYNGEPFNISESDDAISMMLIQRFTDIVAYEVLSHGDFTNRLVLDIK